MAKKDAARTDAGATRPKQLRKQLRKAEAKLSKAESKRAKAQARVVALAIIADEIRAQLAESEGPSTEAEIAVAPNADVNHAIKGRPERASRRDAATSSVPGGVTDARA